MRKKTLILMAMLVLLMVNNPVTAEQADEKRLHILDIGRIVVTPTKTEELAGQSGCSVNVVGEDEIIAKGARTVFEAIEGIPGLDVVETGSTGGNASVFIRGANSEHVLVMVDGIEMNDPMSATRSFDFTNLTIDNIDRIEVLRGPQSTLYGSDALGGVINIITKKGHGEPKYSLLSEFGSYQTYRNQIGLSGSSGKFDYSAFVSRFDTDGISRAAEGKEEDGYENTTASTRLGLELINDARLDFVLRYINADTDLDRAAYEDDPNYTSKSDTSAWKLSFKQPLFKWWEQAISISSLRIKRKYRNYPDAFDTTDYYDWYKGIDRKLDWQHDFFLGEVDTISLGFEYDQEKGHAYGFDKKSLENKAYYLQNQFALWERFFLTAGVRTDRHEKFGSDTNHRLALACIIGEFGTKFNGSWATGFKAPSIFQLYSSYGDPNLSPEEVRSYDLSIEQKFLKDMLTAKTVYFHNDFKQLIEYDLFASKYANVGKVRTKGVETEIEFKPFEKLSLTGSYTYLNGKNLSTGREELTRRPKHKSSLTFSYYPIEKLKLNASINYIGRHWDDLSLTVRRKQHAKVNLSAQYELNDNFTIFGRIDNLFDKNYQEVYGYESQGVSFYGGAKTTF